MNVIEQILLIKDAKLNYKNGESKVSFYCWNTQLVDDLDPGPNGDIITPSKLVIRKMQQTGAYFIPKGTKIEWVEIDWSKNIPFVTLMWKSSKISGPWIRPSSLGEGKSWEELYKSHEEKKQKELEFPSDWVELMPDMKINHSFQKEDECLDLMANQPHEIAKYLSKNPNHIVILGFSSQSDEWGVQNSICTSRRIIQKLSKDKTFVYMPCIGPNGSWPVAKKTQFLKLSFPHYQAYVPFKDLKNILNGSDDASNLHQLYKLHPSNLEIASTASLDSATKGSTFVSGDHCQRGTSKKISRIVPVIFENNTAKKKNGSSSAVKKRRF